MNKANANSAKPREKQRYLEEMLLGDPSFAYKMLIEVGQTERRYSMGQEAIQEHQCSGMRHYCPTQEKLKVKVKSTLVPLLRYFLAHI